MVLQLLSIWLFSAIATASNCYSTAQAIDLESLRQNIAIIGSDDRVVRKSGDVVADIERAQARTYCLKKSFKGKGTPTKSYFYQQEAFVSNSVFAFQDDMVIMPRHQFLNKKGKKDFEARNCYIEHISSGEIIPLVDVEYPAQISSTESASIQHNDFAVAKLKHAPSSGAGSLKRNDIIVDRLKDLNAKVKVISNYASNNTGKPADALTLTTCKRYGQYNLPSGALSNAWGTDCDTGDGSSGAQAYLDVGGAPKLFGIVTGETAKDAPGSPWSANRNTTVITGFDESIFESYEKLKGRIDL